MIVSHIEDGKKFKKEIIEKFGIFKLTQGSVLPFTACDSMVSFDKEEDAINFIKNENDSFDVIIINKIYFASWVEIID